MTTTISIRLDAKTRTELEKLARRARRSRSFLAAEAISAYVESERWQLKEIQSGIDELDSGRGIRHSDVSRLERLADDERESAVVRRHRGRLSRQATALVREQAKP